MTTVNSILLRLSVDFLMHAHVNPPYEPEEVADVLRGENTPINPRQAKTVQDTMQVIVWETQIPGKQRYLDAVPELVTKHGENGEVIARFVSAANDYAHALTVSRQDSFNIYSLVADGKIEAVSDDVLAELKRRNLVHLVEAYDPEAAKETLKINPSTPMPQTELPQQRRHDF